MFCMIMVPIFMFSVSLRQYFDYCLNRYIHVLNRKGLNHIIMNLIYAVFF